MLYSETEHIFWKREVVPVLYYVSVYEGVWGMEEPRTPCIVQLSTGVAASVV